MQRALPRARPTLSVQHGVEAYFIFDDGTVQTRDFFTRFVKTRGLQAPTKSIPFQPAWIMASLMETAWKVLRRRGSPPVTRELVKLTGGPFVVSDRKARTKLGYAPVISREEAIANMTRPAVATG